ncbi:FAD-binding dehydrogenase [Brachybacterium hainanense]|uniref:FAD-binding dehydrogenase n=1 Tax=Brachybacterium hainanense TaxID=1541174 RepID=A0ABV6REB7_9MICO
MTARGEADAIVVGAGLAGLVAAREIAEAGLEVLLLEREGAQDLGGQAWWSFGGLFLVDTPEQRRLGVRDSLELARQDWFGSAGFEGPDDAWPHAWAEAFLRFSAGEARSWLRELGHRIFPVVGWAERGDGTAQGHGNSVPRFHITWGTGPGVVDPFLRRVLAHPRIRVLTRHAVHGLIREEGRIVGVRGDVLEPDASPRGVASSRETVGDFEMRAGAVVLTTGGIGGDEALVRQHWPAELGTMPRDVLHGVPASVDGEGLLLGAAAGGRWIHPQRMWHYTEGVANWDPVWRGHGIRILPGPSSLWLDAHGRRLPAPAFPGFDTRATLRHLRTAATGAETRHPGPRDHSWFILTPRILEKEFALSGSEQNPDLTGRDWRRVAARLRPGPPPPVQAFLDHGEDFLRADTVPELVTQMNALVGEDLLDAGQVETTIRARDAEAAGRLTKDQQIMAIRAARGYVGDRLIRTAAPHRLLDASAGGLIAVRLRTLLRKTLGGLETDLEGRVQQDGGTALPGLYAAGEVSGFGGGGYHGHNSLEGTFLGGCLFSGRQAGRGVVQDQRGSGPGIQA